MKALVVGLGSIGRRHARNWAALGLGDVWVCRLHGAPQPEPLGVEVRHFGDLQQALKAGPDAVLVTNPTSLHIETARQAVRAGAHVLVEKPLGHRLDGAAELLAEAQANQRVLIVGYNLRFHPGLARVRELLRGGAIGRPLSARAEMGDYLPGWHPWEDYRASYSGRGDLGGGAVLTLSHELDALCWLLGRPTHVLGLATHVSALETDSEDVAELIVKFASGAIGSVHVDYLRRPPRRAIEIIGEEGTLRWDYDANRVFQYAPAARAWRREDGDPAFERNRMFLAELSHFAAATRGEAGPETGQQGAGILALALAGLQASKEGRTIELNEFGAPVTTWLSSLES